MVFGGRVTAPCPGASAWYQVRACGPNLRLCERRPAQSVAARGMNESYAERPHRWTVRDPPYAPLSRRPAVEGATRGHPRVHPGSQQSARGRATPGRRGSRLPLPTLPHLARARPHAGRSALHVKSTSLPHASPPGGVHLYLYIDHPRPALGRSTHPSPASPRYARHRHVAPATDLRWGGRGSSAVRKTRCCTTGTPHCMVINQSQWPVVLVSPRRR